MTTIGEFLDKQLGLLRLRDLNGLIAQIADRPLGDTVTDLRTTLQDRRLSGEDHWRLQILVSELYHRSGGDQALATSLRAEVVSAYAASRTTTPDQTSKGGEPHVVSD